MACVLQESSEQQERQRGFWDWLGGLAAAGHPRRGKTNALSIQTNRDAIRDSLGGRAFAAAMPVRFKAAVVIGCGRWFFQRVVGIRGLHFGPGALQ